jgi:hypothetical protein
MGLAGALLIALIAVRGRKIWDITRPTGSVCAWRSRSSKCKWKQFQRGNRKKEQWHCEWVWELG